VIIDTFHANYLMPTTNADPFALKKRMDHIASNLLGQEIEPLLDKIPLEPSFLIFIKKLSVHCVLNPVEIDDRTAARLWAQRLTAAVTKAMQTLPVSLSASGAAGKETGSNVALFQNQATYLAHFIHDLAGTPGPPGEVLNKWYYYQFKDLTPFSIAHIVKAVCKQNCSIIEAVFSLLEQMGRTQEILGSLTEADARFFYSLLPGKPFEAAPEKETRLYEQVLGFITDMIQKGLISPAFVYAYTRSYKLSLKIYLLFLTLQKKYPALRSRESVKETIRKIVLESPGVIPLPHDIGSRKTAGEGQRVKTAYGGLFLLIPVLREIHLVDILQASALPEKNNILAVNALLFFTASELVRQNRNPVSHKHIDMADPGFFIFAGMEPLASTQYLKAYPKGITTAICERFLSKLMQLGAQCPPQANKAIDYQTVAVSLSQLLLQLFARRLKGFETSSGSYLLEHFLSRPAEIWWNRTSIRILLSPKPLDTVLRMSGMVEETGRVPWLNNRNLSFQLPGE
jgi:hypothetical protein